MRKLIKEIVEAYRQRYAASPQNDRSRLDDWQYDFWKSRALRVTEKTTPTASQPETKPDATLP